MFRFLALGALAALSGCASSGTITPGQDVTLATSQQVTLTDAATLRYVGIANDSRCPPDVQCIRAGDADVLFDFTAAGATTSRIALNTERRLSAPIGTWQLRLVSLAQGEQPHVTVRIEAGAR